MICYFISCSDWLFVLVTRQVVALRDDALCVGSKIGTVGRQCSIRIDCWQPECLAMIFTSRQRFSFKPVTNAQKRWNIFEQIQSKRLWNFSHCILPWGENLSIGRLLGTKLLPGVIKTKMSNPHWLPKPKLKLLVNLSYFALTYCTHCSQWL